MNCPLVLVSVPLRMRVADEVDFLFAQRATGGILIGRKSQGADHGDKEQTDRLLVMKRFKNGEFKILIATDVSARGIDIPNVDFVVNYDLAGKTRKLCTPRWSYRQG